MDRPPLRVVICDDSPAYAKALTAYLEHDRAIEVAGAFTRAEDLLAQLARADCDLVIMDLEMPGMGGLRAIEQIMRERPMPILVLSAFAERGSERAAEALAAGALEAAAKSSLRLFEPDDVWAVALRSRIKRLATVRVRRVAPSRPGAGVSLRSPALDRPARVVAIGASTGGPPALISVLADLPADYRIPVLVVQHIATGFIEGLVRWLGSRLALPVGFATEHTPARPGIWFAPDDAHLGLDRSMRFCLDATTRRGAHRPSVDMLFDSVAGAVGRGAVGVVLTGMGRDGAEGVESIRAAGGLVIAQDEQTSAVFGMPRAAIECGADLVLALGDVGPAIGSLRAGSVVS